MTDLSDISSDRLVNILSKVGLIMMMAKDRVDREKAIVEIERIKTELKRRMIPGEQ